VHLTAALLGPRSDAKKSFAFYLSSPGMNGTVDCRASLAMTLFGLPRFARNDAAWIAALRSQ
jgi:hypothetical protein